MSQVEPSEGVAPPTEAAPQGETARPTPETAVAGGTDPAEKDALLAGIPEEDLPEAAEAGESRPTEASAGQDAPDPETQDPGPSAWIPPGEGSAQDWAPYDFRAQSRELAAGELARLEDRGRRLAGSAAARLTLLLRDRVHLEPAPLASCRYAEYQRGLSDPSCLCLVKVRSLDDRFLLALSPSVLLAMLERLLGAPKPVEPPPDRGLTPLERSLATPVIRRILEALDEAWTDGGEPLGLEVVEIESRPLLLQARRPEETVVRMGFRVETDATRGDLSIAVPRGPLLTWLGGFGSRAGAGSTCGSATTDGSVQRLLPRLEEETVPVSVDFDTRPLPLSALLGLQPGDIVDTGVGVRAPVDVRVAGRRVASGQVGEHRGRLGVRVLRSPE